MDRLGSFSWHGREGLVFQHSYVIEKVHLLEEKSDSASMAGRPNFSLIIG